MLEFDKAQATTILGMTWTPKKVVSDDRGAVLLMLKDGQFDFPVGEIYCSMVCTGQVKGWKLHHEMWQRYSVPVGSIKFVVIDDRPESKTRGVICEVESGATRYGVLTVPPGVWYSFKNLADTPSLIVNAASISRRDGESRSVSLESFDKYRW